MVLESLHEIRVNDIKETRDQSHSIVARTLAFHAQTPNLIPEILCSPLSLAMSEP